MPALRFGQGSAECTWGAEHPRPVRGDISGGKKRSRLRRGGGFSPVGGRVGETVSGTASREKPAGERERRPDRRSVLRRVRKTARHADSPGRRSGSLRLFGRSTRPAPGFRNGASKKWIANSCIRSVLAGILRFPARRAAAGRVCRPTVPETVTPHLEKPHAEKIPTGGPTYREAVERLRTPLMHCVDEGDPAEILCARLGCQGRHRQRKVACGVRTVGFRREFRRGSGCWHRRT